MAKILTPRVQFKTDTEVLYKAPAPLIMEGCMKQLSSVCSICGKMRVEKHKHNGIPCTKSGCGLGFWKGGNSWNRLYNPM